MGNLLYATMVAFLVAAAVTAPVWVPVVAVLEAYDRCRRLMSENNERKEE